MIKCCCLVISIIGVSMSYYVDPNDFKIQKHNGTYEKTETYNVDSSTEHIVIFPPSNTIKPYRVVVESRDASRQNPVLVVVRQEKEVLSWEIPLLVESTLKDKQDFYWQTSRTVCHNNIKSILKSYSGLISAHFKSQKLVSLPNLSQYFIVVLSSSSEKPVNVSLAVIAEQQFYVTENETYSLSISPSQPRYVMYRFAEDESDTVIIEVMSADDVCLTVSVQNTTCPVMDLNKDITYEGQYQTINTKGALTVPTNKFADGFFLVFVAKPDNYDCSQEHSVLPVPYGKSVTTLNRTSVIEFKVKRSINDKDYYFAVVMTLAAIFTFGLVSALMVYSFSRCGNASDTHETDIASPELYDESQPVTREEVEIYLQEDKLTLEYLAKFPRKNKKRSFNYLWHILSIAIFYSIPVVQLVITYQRVVNRTGNQDMCYYNFRCAHPAFGLSDFNHVFSNMGYGLTGVLILIVIAFKHKTVPIRYQIGIPVHYGLFYAMGVALIIEGLLSACYHICPSQSNYQFDTSFMYVMAVLCMIKLYQNRHPDINATAYATFTVLGIAIFLAMLGILNGTLAVWILFAVMYSALCIYISFKIYFLSFIMEGMLKLKQDFSRYGFETFIFAPIKKVRFGLLFLANLINCAILVTGLCLYDSGGTDFGTFLLGLLMCNAILHAIFYTLMKLIHKERICLEAICYGLLAITFWACATMFFLNPATLWTVTPAQSRQWNEDCIVFKFFDKHDIWHLLSAPALYFTFMFLMCLDDDLSDVPQRKIIIF